ncbi:MAG TPA: M20/M25/M40 family metallo-hydrolase [Candidatus Tectomicrobia bacterium]|nr:M20/M25/M40 family metallo-hydrolase [Candidatus Tectomicrobia bacterium]
MTTLAADRTLAHVQQVWDDRIVPALTEYVRIPAKSPAFDPAWQQHGHLDAAVALVERWARARPIEGLRVEVVRLPGRTPLLLLEAPGRGDDTVLLYGHVDKQPEMVGWAEGLGPWTPVRRGDRLYGRGVADDGYAAFCALTAIEALQAAGIPHARCVTLIEACEESGSPDLPAYLDALAGRLRPTLVIGLDSGCGDYERLWLTTSLRGLVGGVLTVEVLTEGIHSGASGAVPSSFRIARALLSRLEDERTGRILPGDLHVEVPPERLEQARAAAKVLGDELWRQYPWAPGMRPAHDDPVELLLAQTWRPALSVIGAEGLPPLADAGNVLRPKTALKLSLRLAPTTDAAAAARRVKTVLESDPPHGARVTFTPGTPSGGWDAPPTAPWLADSLERASRAFFGAPPMAMGLGGTIPFMSMLGERFPDVQFLITGVLGPESNAHGPNEFLDLPTGVRLTACVAQVLADHHARPR